LTFFPASSKFFEDLFSNSDTKEVFFRHLEFRTLDNMILFIYSGKVPDNREEFDELVNEGKRVGLRGLPSTWPDARPHVLPEKERGKSLSDVETCFFPVVL
jgi:hypothetical protein